MKNKLLCIVATLLLCYHAQAFTFSIEGPTTVCPNVEQTYRINFLGNLNLGQDVSYGWTIEDEDGLRVATRYGSEMSFTFPHPQNRSYTITAYVNLHFLITTTLTKSITVNTKYPKPSLSAPHSACPGETIDITGTVNAEFECFHHKLDWQVPGGWSYTTFGGIATIVIPPNTPTGKYAVRSRVYYDDINEYGDFITRYVWVGPPVVSSLLHPAVFGCTAGEIHAVTGVRDETFEWKVIGGIISESGTTTYTGGESIFVDPANGPYGFTVQVRASNSCGKSDWFSKNISTNCSSSGSGPNTIQRQQEQANTGSPSQLKAIPSIYPNPANEKVSINLSQIPANIDQVFTVEVYDLSSNLLIKAQTSETSVTLDVSPLKNGVHIMQISGPEGTVRKRLMIRH